MRYDEHELAPASLLRGHVSGETAYLVEGRPGLAAERGQVRYWLHTGQRGEAKGQVRLMKQFTDPAISGDHWRGPTAGAWTSWAVLYLDSIGHVDWWPVGRWGPNPWEHLRFRVRTLFAQLNVDERARYDELVRLGVQWQTDAWERAKKAFPLIASGMSRQELYAEVGIHVDEQDQQIALAAHATGISL